MKKESARKYIWVIVAGAATGACAVLLSALGNPANMGFCIACFLRDIAGACQLHSAAVVQYVRPEIAGLVAGAMIMALAFKEWRPQGGSSPFTRFFLGMIVMVGALVFLGCPLRMVIRLGGGDLNALVGLIGFAVGILVGALALNKGFSLKRAYRQSALEGGLFPVGVAIVLILSVLLPQLFVASAEGPGSMRAPVLVSLAAGLVVGALCQRSRLCMAGGIRDAVLFKDFSLLAGFGAIFVVVIIGNLILGKFNLGFAEQPVAHSDGLWNFLGMAVVGWGSVLLGGCPLRQLVLSGEGNSDSAVTVMGMIAGAAASHNLGLASSASGVSERGPVAVVVCLVLIVLVTLLNIQRKKA